MRKRDKHDKNINLVICFIDYIDASELITWTTNLYVLDKGLEGSLKSSAWFRRFTVTVFSTAGMCAAIFGSRLFKHRAHCCSQLSFNELLVCKLIESCCRRHSMIGCERPREFTGSFAASICSQDQTTTSRLLALRAWVRASSSCPFSVDGIG